MPEFDEAAEIISNLSAPIAMMSGKTWAENLAISPTISQAHKASSDNLLLKENNNQRINANGKQFFEKKVPVRERKKLFYLDF